MLITTILFKCKLSSMNMVCRSLILWHQKLKKFWNEQGQGQNFLNFSHFHILIQFWKITYFIITVFVQVYNSPKIQSASKSSSKKVSFETFMSNDTFSCWQTFGGMNKKCDSFDKTQKLFDIWEWCYFKDEKKLLFLSDFFRLLTS